MDAATAEQMSERQRAVWSAGDWPTFAPIIQSVADEVVEAVEISEGDDYLDVATGSGNAAIAAAQRGARVTGLDLVPELVEAARARFAAAGLEAELVVGNAEELPFEDASFDRLTSLFGAMFAPRHEVAAGELVRVARPGAKIAVTAWTPEGLNGQMFGTLGKHMPLPPDGFVPPVMWGSEEHVRDLFSAPGLEVECEKRMATLEFESAEGWMDYCEQNLGPIVMAKAMLEPQGKWEPVRAELSDLEQGFNEADDGSMRARAEYLLTTVTKPS
jgi:SAM-dependent methyltransferase